MLNLALMSNSTTPLTVAHQAPLSTGFPRQEYWNRLPFPPPGDLSDPGKLPSFSLRPPQTIPSLFTSLTFSFWNTNTKMSQLSAHQNHPLLVIASSAIEIISLVFATLFHLVSSVLNQPDIYPFFWIISKNNPERSPLPAGH